MDYPPSIDARFANIERQLTGVEQELNGLYSRREPRLAHGTSLGAVGWGLFQCSMPAYPTTGFGTTADYARNYPVVNTSNFFNSDASVLSMPDTYSVNVLRDCSVHVSCDVTLWFTPNGQVPYGIPYDRFVYLLLKRNSVFSALTRATAFSRISYFSYLYEETISPPSGILKQYLFSGLLNFSWHYFASFQAGDQLRLYCERRIDSDPSGRNTGKDDFYVNWTMVEVPALDSSLTPLTTVTASW